MKKHKPYNESLGHPHDFEVEYRFYTADEGGRKTGPPFQGYRSDFWYENDNHMKDQIFIIRPEFLNINGELILDLDEIVPLKGRARMWIAENQMRKYHQGKINIGLTGYFMEGPTKVAVCTVTELNGLMTNPTN